MANNQGNDPNKDLKIKYKIESIRLSPDEKLWLTMKARENGQTFCNQLRLLCGFEPLVKGMKKGTKIPNRKSAKRPNKFASKEIAGK